MWLVEIECCRFAIHGFGRHTGWHKKHIMCRFGRVEQGVAVRAHVATYLPGCHAILALRILPRTTISDPAPRGLRPQGKDLSRSHKSPEPCTSLDDQCSSIVSHILYHRLHLLGRCSSSEDFGCVTKNCGDPPYVPCGLREPAGLGGTYRVLT